MSFAAAILFSAGSDDRDQPNSFREKVDMNQLLDRAFELTGYHEKRQRFANRENATDAAAIRAVRNGAVA